MEWPWSKRNTAPVKADFEPPAKGLKGFTLRLESSRQRSAFDQATKTTLEVHKEYNRVYEGSIAGSVIDTEVDDIFAQGWSLLGEDDEDVGKVRDYLTAMGFESEVRKLAIESKVYGFGLAEVGTVGPRHKLVAHSSLNIVPKMDENGWLDTFDQMGAENQILAQWKPREVVTLALRPSAATPGTGYSELMHSYESIRDYEDIRKANCEMVMRMGYPSYNIEFDSDGIAPSGFIEGEVADLSPGSILETGLGAKINTLNASGVTQVNAYAEMALQAISASMQVPRAMVGLSDNSEATAKVNLGKYYNRIAAEQGIIAQTMQSRYLDIYVLPDCGLKAGDVQIVFKNPDPEAQVKRADLIAKLCALDPTDPEFLLSVEEMAEIWGKHPRPGEYDGGEAKTILQERLSAHLREALGLPNPTAQAPTTEGTE